MLEHLRLEGRYDLSVLRAGRRIVHRAGKNLVVTQGKNRAALLLGSAATVGTIAKYLRLGTDGTAPNIAQTGLLGTTVFGPQDISIGGSISANIITLQDALVNAGAAFPVLEIGIFWDTAAASLFSRFTPQEFTFGTGDTLIFVWSLEVG